MIVLNFLSSTIRSAATHNPDAQSPPACILWPDGDRQWESVIARLQSEIPELFQLGDYLPGKKIGPAIWLRCVIAGTVDAGSMPTGCVPIIYLPGVSRQDLRAVESCPEPLKPLAELQFRGVIWSQANSKDWTVRAFLKSAQGGLGLDVAKDTDTLQALQLALYCLLDEELELLKGRHLDRDFFNNLLSGGDPIRELLQWLNQGDAFRAARTENQWRGFVEICKSQLGFDPENDGPVKAAGLLAYRKANWDKVWGRFCEAPTRYTVVPSLIRKTQLPPGLFDDKSSWPQWNEAEERNLRQLMLKTAQVPAHEARQQILDAEEQHARRRELVWAELGESPLAVALKSLTTLAEVTKQTAASGTLEELSAAYQTSGWTADAAVLEAVAAVQSQDDLAAVRTVIQSLYLPWLDDSARHLQKLVAATTYPGRPAASSASLSTEAGDVFLFVDGLRFDVARSLDGLLRQQGYAVEVSAHWAALPSVTATAKPAVTPVRHLIRGQDVNADFEPSVAATGQSLKGGYQLKKLLTDSGWQLLDHQDTGDPRGTAWTEVGDIDHEGHVRGSQLSRNLDGILRNIRDRVSQLLASGWKNVRIVADHGWLLLPGGLPKTELPAALSDNTWGRCAAIKPGAACNESLYPWYWNADLNFALAPGVSCYRAGVEYTHGGLSLQECLVAFLHVTTQAGGFRASSTQIQSVSWKGMRCKVTLSTSGQGLLLDIRTHPANAVTSVTTGEKPFKGDGTASVVIEDDSLMEHEATIVILDPNGQLLAQKTTIIGSKP
jgi:hypothetical protein